MRNLITEKVAKNTKLHEEFIGMTIKSITSEYDTPCYFYHGTYIQAYFPNMAEKTGNSWRAIARASRRFGIMPNFITEINICGNNCHDDCEYAGNFLYMKSSWQTRLAKEFKDIDIEEENAINLVISEII